MCPDCIVLSLVVASILSGICTQKLGYYVPAMLLSPSVMAVGEGLMSTFDGGTTTPHWVGYQFPAGFGIGLGMQVSGLAMQTVLPPPDISTGIAIMFFGQQLGGAVFTSVGQTILSNLLASRLSGVAGLDPRRIVNEGATNLVAIVPPELMGVVQAAYNYACTRIFLAAMGLTFAALICALMMEWRSIKKGKNGQGPPGSGLGPGVPAAAQAGAPLHSELAPRSLESVDLEAVEVERITEEKFKDGQWTDASSQRQLS
ncbi:hypothetical protein VTK73DRAFT_10249 [Phialemonium thermophilum]|uniref:Uncharacterized protein n=1 Tax=Phialemonium thermophilum TaxID=223376 RepID=A0ABR3VXN4_9PEZI